MLLSIDGSIYKFDSFTFLLLIFSSLSKKNKPLEDCRRSVCIICDCKAKEQLNDTLISLISEHAIGIDGGQHTWARGIGGIYPPKCGKNGERVKNQLKRGQVIEKRGKGVKIRKIEGGIWKKKEGGDKFKENLG